MKQDTLNKNKRDMRRCYIIMMLNLLMVVGLSACNGIDPVLDPITYGENYIAVQLSTDKAQYKPGDEVKFSLTQIPEGADLMVRYRHLGETLD